MAESDKSRRSWHLIHPNKPEKYVEAPTDGVPIQHVPGFTSHANEDKMIILGLNQNYLFHVDTDEIDVLFNWSTGEDIVGFDVDASATLFDKNMDCVDFIWWDNLSTDDGSIKFASVDDTVGEGMKDKESIKIFLKKVPFNVASIVFAFSVYTKDKNSSDLIAASFRAIDCFTNKNVFSCFYEGPFRGTSTILGAFTRRGAWWQFTPLRQPLLARTITEIMFDKQNLGIVKSLPSQDLVKRRVKIIGALGKDLTPMDNVPGFRKSSDPYLRIFYKDKMFPSEIEYTTLNPIFKIGKIDLGEVSEADRNIVEIECWDYDTITKDDLMGVIKFSLGGLIGQCKIGKNEVWMPFSPTAEQIRKKEKIHGDLMLELMLEEIC